MKFLFDFFPLILFFAAYQLSSTNEAAALSLVEQYLGGMIFSGKISANEAATMLSTIVAMIATVLQVSYLLARRRRVGGMLWVSLVVIVIFGSMTVYLHNETFIKWKPTILYWIFAAALLISQICFDRNLVRKAMEEALQLPEAVWSRVGFTWVAFLFVLGGLNLMMAFVIYRDNTAAWVNFKVFGTASIFFAFAIGQSMLLMRHVPREKS